MIQYLLNASAIWLLSLLLFDLFFKRQSQHMYNRAYLLLTFIAGITMPLWQWQQRTVVDSEVPTVRPEDAVAVLKYNITDATPVHTFLSFENILMAVYAIGVAIGFLFLVKEIYTIVKMYRTGTRSKDGVWTIVETGKEHSPFSAFNTIFISNKQNYDADDLQTILMHEQQHVLAYHFFDLLLMQMGKLLFWFHPLVYIYHNRLMMVHEYQADKAAVNEPTTYGKFLLEQSMLHRAPAFTHSFNRSPIKNRIIMLTRSSASRMRYILPVPLMLVFVLCFTKNSFSGERKLSGNKVTLNGNVFEVKIFPQDTMIVQNPATGEENMMVTKREPLPLTMNGKQIYEEQDVNIPVSAKNLTQKQLRAAIIDKNRKALGALKDGRYQLNFSSVVVGPKGKIVYYDEPYIIHLTDNNAEREKKERIETAVKEVARSLEELNILSPAMLNGEAVLAFYSGMASKPYGFEVKNHVVTLVE
ncbi:MAG: M56 family metallopeptidase [Chitinophagaceae bacterium]|nr:MAG: M56 family metallopeptidase [Chitinophagaceae bacterium]